MFRAKLKNARKKGALSMEMMGVIAVIGVIASAGIYYMNVMMRDTKINNTISAMQTIHVKLSEMYANESGYGDDIVEKLIKSGNAPKSLVSGSNLRSPWGGIEISAASSGESGNDDDTFAMKFTSVPYDVCQRFGQAINSSGTWKKLAVGTTAYDADDDADESLLDFLSTNCGDKGIVDMTFTARRQ